MISPLPTRLVALAGLSVTLGALHAAGAALPAPPVDPTAWPAWWSATDSLATTSALLRLLALAVGAWLLLVTLIDTVATAISSARLSHIAGAIAPAFWRTLVLRPVTAGVLALPPLMAPMSIAPAMAQTAVETAPADAVSTAEPDPGVRTITMRWHEPDTSVDEPDVDEPSEAAPTTAAPPAVDRPDAHVHRVGPGENLWSIAAAHLRSELGHRPSSAEVTRYWTILIEANRDRLPDPTNPDLIYAGIELTLPAQA